MATLRSKYEELIGEVKKYAMRFNSTRAVEACTLPAYGQPGQDTKEAKSSPNVFFVKDLITQVMTAKSLGFETKLYSDGSNLVVTYVETKPPIPNTLHFL